MSKRTVVEWSPHDASLFAVGADTLRLFEISTSSASSGSDAPPTGSLDARTTQRKRSFRVVKINAKVSQLKCLEWYPFASKPLLIAAGTGSGKVVLSDFQDPRARSARELLPKYSRPCHAVAWNRAMPNQLAAGFEKVRSDFCTLVWDLNTAAGIAGAGGGSGPTAAADGSAIGGTLEPMSDGEVVKSSNGGVGGSGGVSVGVGVGVGGGSGGLAAANSKPMHELSNSEATLALSWVPLQPTCLATGTGFKWLRIYDLRAKATPLSVVAHNKAVIGVAFDEHRPNILATFSDSPQEPVKVWDIRQLEASTGPLLTIQQTSKSLSQVSWCPSKPGILVTASTDEKWISLWDVSSHDMGESNVLRKPFRRRYTSEGLASFSWQNIEARNPSRRSSVVATKSHIAAAAFPNRLLTASASGEIEDISVHDSMPVTVSSTGAVAFSCGKLLFGGVPNGPGLGTAASSRLALESDMGMNAVVDDDISSQMYRLAKSGYSVVLSKNLKLFSGRRLRERQLRQLWLWVDQVEALRRIQASWIAHSKASNTPSGPTNGVAPGVASAGALRGWPFDPNVLVNIGVKNLLATSSSSGEVGGGWDSVDEESKTPPKPQPRIVSVMKTDPVLGCQFFEGLGRRLSVLACNWDPDCGQGASRSSSSSGNAQALESASGRANFSLHASNMGVWNSHKQPLGDSSSPGFHRSWNESARYELGNILTRCEMDGQYARAAAIAVFHGDLSSAVSYLKKGAMWLTQSQHLNIGVTAPYSPDVLQLAAMAVAGYVSSTVSPAGQALWSSMCQELLKREEIVSSSQPRYLHAMLAFLCAASAPASTSSNPRGSQPQAPRRGGNPRRQWGSADALSAFSASRADSYSAILTDSTLPLSDRVAFACRYLAEDDLRSYILQLEDESARFGRLEGLVITGLNAVGVRLLQKYLDATGDIQTLALLAARLPSAQAARMQPMDRWVQIYKDLLNRWQLFHERARFDVGRSQLEDLLSGFASFSRDPGGEELGAELAAPAAPSVPPQLFVRCNFCNTTLSLASLLRLGGSHSSWLNRTKPKLSCCPTCRKPLPQCALCLLPFGSLNPYFELAHRRSKQTAEAVSSLVSAAGESGAVLKDPKSGKSEYESLAQLSSIPFVEWFTWCQACKHGGHAHHIAEWFSSHAVCPVTDCDCKCQFLDSPVMLNDKQNEQLAQQQRAAAAVASTATIAAAAKAAQRQTSSSKRHHPQQQQRQQQQQQQQQAENPTLTRNAKSFQQQGVFPGDWRPHLSTSASIGHMGPSYHRVGASGLLRPSTASSIGLPPFSLSGSTSSSMLNLSGSSAGVAAGGVAASGGGPGSAGGKDMALAMGRALGNKLDKLEQEGNYMQYM